jgi:hypothetical protein
MAIGVQTRLVVTVAVATVAIGFFIWWRSPPGETLASVLWQLGYLEVTAPSTHYGPGTINTIEVTSDQKIILRPTCDVDPQMLSPLTKESPTTDSTLTQRLAKNYNIVAQVKSIISSEISDNRVKDISIQFKDVKILHIADEHLIALQGTVVHGDCQKAIEWNLRNSGIHVCQTQAVLAADVVYKITYKEQVTARGQETSTGNGAVKFQVGTAEDTVNQTSGKRLFYGVQLARYGILLNTPDAQPVSCQGGQMFGSPLSQSRHRPTWATLLGIAQSDE